MPRPKNSKKTSWNPPSNPSTFFWKFIQLSRKMYNRSSSSWMTIAGTWEYTETSKLWKFAALLSSSCNELIDFNARARVFRLNGFKPPAGLVNATHSSNSSRHAHPQWAATQSAIPSVVHCQSTELCFGKSRASRKTARDTTVLLRLVWLATRRRASYHSRLCARRPEQHEGQD